MPAIIIEPDPFHSLGAASTETSHFPAKLLELPQELLISIISHVEFLDVYSLRATCHPLHHVIHKHESTIVRNHCFGKLDVQRMAFKARDTLSLDYGIELRYRLRQTIGMASLLASRCCEKLKPPQPFDGQEAWQKRKTEKLHDLVGMGLLDLYEFLAQFRQVVLRSLHDFEGCLSADFARLGFVLGFDQQRIFERFPPATFVPTLQAWRMLEGFANAQSVPLTCRATKYPYTSVKTLLVLGGLGRFGHLLRRPSLEDRLADLAAFNDELWNGRTGRPCKALAGPPLNSIQHLAPPSKGVSLADLPQESPHMALLTFIDRQEICESSLLAVMLRSRGNLQHVCVVDEFICDEVREEGDPDYILLRWNQPDTA